jgi:polyisoprenoid-binding protein YceI
MRNSLYINATKFAGLGAFATLLVCVAAGESVGRKETVEVSGVTEFEAPTNVPAVSVKGKSTSVQGRVTVSHETDGIVLEHIEAWTPVKTLETGMAVRNEHMRKHVFTTPDGQAPDLRFESGKASCPARGGQEYICQVAGDLSIHGVARPFTIQLKVRQAGGPGAFKAAGEAVVKLSDYDIPQPTQFGVKVLNEVKLRFEFSGKPRPVESARSGEAQ